MVWRDFDVPFRSHLGSSSSVSPCEGRCAYTCFHDRRFVALADYGAAAYILRSSDSTHRFSRGLLRTSALLVVLRASLPRAVAMAPATLQRAALAHSWHSADDSHGLA